MQPTERAAPAPRRLRRRHQRRAYGHRSATVRQQVEFRRKAVWCCSPRARVGTRQSARTCGLRSRRAQADLALDQSTSASAPRATHPGESLFRSRGRTGDSSVLGDKRARSPGCDIQPDRRRYRWLLNRPWNVLPHCTLPDRGDVDRSGPLSLRSATMARAGTRALFSDRPRPRWASRRCHCSIALLMR